MENPIKSIYQFNLQAGLLDNGYSDELESSFQIEEALEGFDDLAYLAKIVSSSSPSPKEISRAIIDLATNDVGTSKISDVNRLDKACDSVVFAVGSMAKLGLTPQQITRALNIVMRHNFRKLSMPKDAYGKLTKSKDFISPEADLQALLDERN